MLKLWRANECRGAPSVEVCTEMKNVEIIYNMNAATLVGNMSPMGASREGPERERAERVRTKSEEELGVYFE